MLPAGLVRSTSVKIGSCLCGVRYRFNSLVVKSLLDYKVKYFENGQGTAIVGIGFCRYWVLFSHKGS